MPRRSERAMASRRSIPVLSGARPRSPYYTARTPKGLRSGLRSSSPLTKCGANREGDRRFAGYIRGTCIAPHIETGSWYIEVSSHDSAADGVLSRDALDTAGTCACGGRTRGIEAGSRVRHQGRAVRALERSALSLAESRRTRSDVCGRVEQPRDRLRARGKVRGSEEGVRQGAA